MQLGLHDDVVVVAGVYAVRRAVSLAGLPRLRDVSGARGRFLSALLVPWLLCALGLVLQRLFNPAAIHLHLFLFDLRAFGICEVGRAGDFEQQVELLRVVQSVVAAAGV
jgi:hypothetical protein